MDYWLDRRGVLPDFYSTSFTLEYGAFISLDEVYWGHKAELIRNESLESSWENTHDYFEKSLDIISAENIPSLLDKEEAFLIKESLGPPPPLCYPLYFISVDNGKEEKLVYIGKTSSSYPRFKGGHSALVKLLHPKYDGKDKRIYLATVLLLDGEKNYLPLEWVQTRNGAIDILMKIEAGLINSFTPILNTHHVHSRIESMNLLIHFQNFTDETKFLNNKFIWI